MILIIGLGNPGNQYNFTRHNSGFLALDFLFKKYGLEWESKPKFGAIYKRVRVNEAPSELPINDDIIFLKPQDFYNESGRSVRAFMRFYKMSVADILVVCDDFNLEFGKIRYRASGSSGGNNGLKSIIATLGTEEFARLRIGTGNDELRRRVGDVDFVLSKFTSEEKAELPTVLGEVCERIFGTLG